MSLYRYAVATGLLLLVPLGALAQQTGSVTGTVTDGEEAPLPGANVAIVEVQQGAATTADGTYEITGLEPGEYTVQVSLVGFSTQRATVAIEAGEEVVQNFTLSGDPLDLDEVVVTGQGSEVSRRALGTSMSVINAEDIQETPTTSIDKLLQGRVPGSTIRSQSAQPGQGALINFRGITSVFSNQTPVIYVDGIRVDNSSNTSFSFGGETTSALSEILTNDIERIEITKGGAASTLYGSDAANGVIQVFTADGDPGELDVTFRTKQGVDFPVSRFFKDTGFSFPETRENENSPDFGRTSFIEDEFLERGYSQDYYVGVSGGSEAVTYNLSGRLETGDGVQPNNGNTLYALRGNVGTDFTEDVSVRFSGSYTRSNFSRLSNGTAIADPLTMLEVGDAKFFTGTNSLRAALDMATLPEIKEGVDRYRLSTKADYKPSELFSSSLTVGIDGRVNEQRALFPREADPLTGNTNGSLTRFNRDFKSITLEYRGTISYPREGAITSDFTFGAQGFRDEESRVWAEAETFALPGTEDVGEAGSVTADELREQVFNGGFYFKEQLGYEDHLFLGLGLRFDGNSAFGEDVGLQAYPSLEASYILSDAPFWTESLETVMSQFKLRAAWGQTGKFPDPFTKDVTFQATSFRGTSAPRFSNPGNPNLSPEKTSTLEGGLESSFFDGRFGVDFTLYRSRTADALFEVPEQPATGRGLQFRNVGEIRNLGTELSADVRILQMENLFWQIGGSWSWNENEMESLGGAAPFTIGGSQNFAQQRVREGRPIGAWRATTPFDSNDDGNLDASEFRFTGETPYPTHNGAFTTSFTYGNVRLFALADWSVGSQVLDWGSHWASFNGLERAPRPQKYDENGDPVTDANGEPVDFSTTEAGSALLQDGDYLKIREVTLSYNVPSSFLEAVGLEQGSVYVTGRNLWEFTRQELIDPELAGITDTGNVALGGSQSITLSAPRQIRVGIEVTL
ncbi:MAG: SusC/RagA family TonB-linked outer membrane protein [Salinibacter sp.]|uniref:SusC/RagA family TonB-linked outer membrane protein n=1 Tax=Salinibacter sp. TaxID=2065818 RepID=UPI002FC2E1D4